MQLPWEENTVTVLVMGDVMLDECLDGEVSRISPEAPVPVQRVVERRRMAGGAANAARNVQLAGGKTHLCAVLGQDEVAAQLCEALEQDGISSACLVSAPRRETIRKTRIYAQNQQMLRVDHEQIQPLSSAEQEQLYATAERLRFDVLLLSDYGKGTLPPALSTRLIALAHHQGSKVVVDPYGCDFQHYADADLITPNLPEARRALATVAAQHDDGEQLARALQRHYPRLRDVLVTMGKEGMVYVSHTTAQTPVLQRTRAREVFDVSGAGDTVAALMALAAGCDVPVPQALELASHGAGLVVEKRGTQAVTAAELKQSLSIAESHSSAHKIVDPQQLSTALAQHSGGIVFTNGCFDILHAGHVTFLEQARARGDVLVVALNSDHSVSRLKGNTRPIVPLKARLRLVAALSCVDFVSWFAEDTPAGLIARINPHVLVKGADWQTRDIAGADIVQRQGGTVTTIPLLQGHSTSAIVARIGRIAPSLPLAAAQDSSPLAAAQDSLPLAAAQDSLPLSSSSPPPVK